MANPTRYTFDLKEVATALIRAQGIKHGKWILGFEFNFGAGQIGPSPDDSLPAGFIRVQNALLTRQPDDAPESNLVVDAEKVWSQGQG
ncbi:MAG TPA: hypothetical protein VF226_09910 [Hyphomicrobiaceae bacterium]|jgi:hypothetical protein